jgi:hypothetical protein
MKVQDIIKAAKQLAEPSEELWSKIKARLHTKLCRGCKLEKPTETFHKSKKTKDGFATRCITCYKVWREEYRKTHKTQIQAWAKKGNEKYLSDPRNREKTINRASLLETRTSRGDHA